MVNYSKDEILLIQQHKNSTIIEMPEFVDFQTMGILVPYGITLKCCGSLWSGINFDFQK